MHMHPHFIPAVEIFNKYEKNSKLVKNTSHDQDTRVVTGIIPIKQLN